MASMLARLSACAIATAAALTHDAGSARAEKITDCASPAFCYCIDTELRGAIAQNVAAIRDMIAAQKAQGKAVGYLSIPISTVGGSYYNVNTKVAVEIKERVEKRFGERTTWLLNTAAKNVSLPPNATGPDYMFMWTKVLEGPDGLGAFDFVYFTGPSEFAEHFMLNGTGDMEKLEAAYDSLLKTDPGLKDVPKRAFCDYYGLRASVAFSYGSHDEWNIVRTINQKRRDADPKAGIAGQMAIFFDGRPLPPGLFETPVAAGNVGACRN